MNIIPNKEIPYEDFSPPYKDFLNNWEKYIENTKDFDIYMLGNIPSYVYVELLKRIKEEKDKNNKYTKSLEKLYTKMHQEFEKQKNIDLEKEVKLNAKENEMWYNQLRQAYYDLINLQERGHIIYE